MLTRRDFLTGAAAGVLIRGDFGFAKAAQPSTPANFAVPPHACDCHTHYYGDPRNFPLSPRHVYTPEGLQPEEMSALHRALRIERVVIVTPSVYGTDNSSTLFYMKARGAAARGIAVVDDKTTETEIETMRRLGIRGGRIIATPVKLPDPAAARPVFTAASARFKNHNWHIQIYNDLALVSAIKDLVLASPVPTVFDHFGGLQAALGLRQPGFYDLLDLVRSGSCYVKISGVYRSSTKAPDYPDMAPFAKALIEANPDRILWGTDWPHPAPPIARGNPGGPMPMFPLDDGRLLNLLPVWAPDRSIRQKILVDNPQRLFGF
ncbi:MAG TPA: amidohydrolase family protein [Verrucomicrobiae bacterium]|nr:amidohydrolase family protein [Verrucomicrobiae bacterium]